MNKYLICALSVAPFVLIYPVAFIARLERSWFVTASIVSSAMIFCLSVFYCLYLFDSGKAQKAWKEVLGYE